ncbi:MAG: efflux RND transporter periplasmic adaptor subunit [Anaerolineae bacterium]|nr:efflux RND transporter periplasmic adaptor subunit [Anaerolineae bacterium]
MTALKEFFKQKPWLAFVPLVILAAVAGLIFWFGGAPQAAAESPGYQTVSVIRGDLSVEITGTGNLIAGQEVDLGFSTDGLIREIKVHLGDQVKAGQVLATLDEIDQLQIALDDWKLQLNAARKALDDLLNSGDKALAQALKKYAAAKETYEEAKKNLRQPGDARCAPAKTEEYYYNYLYAQDRVNEWEDYLQYGNTGYGVNYILKVLKPMRQERDAAYYNLKYCEGYTEQEILESNANLQLAEANLKKSEAIYQNLLANAGVDPAQVEIARARLKTAEIQVIKAQNDLDGATIVAPIDGTVVALNAEEGQTVVAINKIQDASSDATIYTSEFITISDLRTPYLDVKIDETDLQNFAVGCPAKISFDAIPGRTFSGKVAQVDPALVTAENVSMVHGLVELKDAEMMPGKPLPLGLTASVEITCSTVQDALLVPVSAWYQSSDGSSYVYVLGDSGMPEKRTVEIGLQGTSYVEIRKGLSEGDSVLISQVKSD